MQHTTRTYFISDFHFGSPNRQQSKIREKLFVLWAEEISSDASQVYILGDLFDFWFEYKHVVPKGYIEILAAIKKLVDKGIKVTLFTGNHDMWMFGYLSEELGVEIYREPIVRKIQGKTLMIGHGDGLGPGDYGYKLLKKIFANPVCQWLFRWIHPDIGIAMANFWSARSRHANPPPAEFLGPEREWILQHCLETLKHQNIDYFVFGHRHLPIFYPINNGQSFYINTGDWIRYFTYAVFDGTEMMLLKYNP